MEGVRHLITTRGRQLAHACLNKSDCRESSYLFKAALSEIRTESKCGAGTMPLAFAASPPSSNAKWMRSNRR